MDEPLLTRAFDLLGDDPLQPKPMEPTLARAIKACPIGSLIAARHRRAAIAVAKLPDGRVFVVPDRCPHDGGRLSDGFLDGSRVVCSRHGWEFDLETGRCVGRPLVQVATKLVKSADS